MKKQLHTHIFTLALLVLLTQTAYAHAEDSVVNSNTTPSSPTGTVPSTTVDGNVRIAKPEPYVPKRGTPIRDVMKTNREDRQEMNKQIGNERKEMNEGIREDRKALASSTASTTPEMRKDFREETKEKREDFREKARDTREDFREGAQEKRQEARLGVMVRIVVNRLNATINRLEKIVVKLDTRIAKFKESGVNVTVATAASAEAKTALANANIHVEAIVIPTDATTASSTQVTIKASVKAVEEDLKLARQAIEKALKSFKGQATTTPITASSTTTIN